MEAPQHGSGAAGMVERLRQATNDHDLDALVACFAPDYRNETPAHPERDFTGRDQVRQNWTQIFAAIGDLRAEVLRSAVEGDTVWSEWEHRGTRPDGTAQGRYVSFCKRAAVGQPVGEGERSVFAVGWHEYDWNARVLQQRLRLRAEE